MDTAKVTSISIEIVALHISRVEKKNIYYINILCKIHVYADVTTWNSNKVIGRTHKPRTAFVASSWKYNKKKN